MIRKFLARRFGVVAQERGAIVQQRVLAFAIQRFVPASERLDRKYVFRQPLGKERDQPLLVGQQIARTALVFISPWTSACWMKISRAFSGSCGP